jgi:hypothetical protein
MRVLFVSPLAGIEQHSVVERELMQNFLDRGDSVGVIRCENDFLQPCGVAIAKGSTSPVSKLTNRAICSSCIKNGNLLFGSNHKIQQFRIADFISRSELSAIDDLVSNTEPDGWMTLEHNGLLVGRLAAYEGFLTYKDHRGVLSGQQFFDYKANLRTVLIMDHVSETLLKDWLPDLVVAYNTLYALHRVWKVRSEEMGIPCYALQHGWDAARRSTSLMIYRDDNDQLLLSSSAESEAYLLEPIDDNAIGLVSRHLLALTQASNVFVYSAAHQSIPPREIRTRLGLDTKRPVIFVPLSSEDERFASGVVGLEFMTRPGNVFSNQLDFIHFLKELAWEHIEWQFVIRVHPRMFPNSRESYVASAAQPLMDALSKDCPDNFRINTPDQGLSLSDVIQVIDLVVAGRSTVGAQCAAYGLPLVLHDVQQLNAFPAQLGLVAHSRFEFSEKIQMGLDLGCRIENAVLAFRWFNFLNNIVAKDISRSADRSEALVLRDFGLAQRAILKLKTFLPDFLQAWLKGRVSNRAVKNFQRELVSTVREFTDLVEVTDRGLAGLHQLRPPNKENSPEAELRGVTLAVLDLCEHLGRFPEDPRCLTSRIVDSSTTT